MSNCVFESAEVIAAIQKDESKFNKYLWWIFSRKKVYSIATALTQQLNCTSLITSSLCTHLPFLKQTDLPKSLNMKLKFYLFAVPQAQLYEYFRLE